MMLFDGSKSKSSKKNPEDPVFRFYVNIFLLNTKDVLHNIVRSKISKNSPVLRALTKRLIVQLVKDETLASRIGADLCTAIPQRLINTGVVATVNVVYQQSAYLCLEVNINSIIVRKVIEKATRGPTALEFYDKLAEKLAWSPFSKWVEDLLVGVVSKKLLIQLPQTIREKLLLKLTANLELITCLESEQGPFLLSTIQELAVDAKKKVPQPPIPPHSPPAQPSQGSPPFSGSQATPGASISSSKVMSAADNPPLSLDATELGSV